MPLRAALCAALLLACAAPPPGAAVEVAQAPHAPPQGLPSFASGTDVFGRDARCRACHALLQNLQGTLVPRLTAQMQREARRRAAAGTPAARRVEFGAYEALIQEDVPRGCLFSTVYHDREVRRACDALLEAHEDAISDVYQRWVQAGGEAATGWSWNLELCWNAARGACPEALARRPLSDFADDGSGAAERTSEAVPPAGTRQDGLLVAVAASLHEAVAGPAVDAADVLLYAAFPRSAAAAHRAAAPAVRAAAALLRAPPAAGGAGPAAFEAVQLDGDANDAPPPHGAGLRAPALALYSAGAKAAPRFLERFAADGGRVTLYDILFFVAAAAGRRDTADAAAALLRTLPDEQLTAQPWDDEEDDVDEVQAAHDEL